MNLYDTSPKENTKLSTVFFVVFFCVCFFFSCLSAFFQGLTRIHIFNTIIDIFKAFVQNNSPLQYYYRQFPAICYKHTKG
jgi:hypothetical protein